MIDNILIAIAVLFGIWLLILAKDMHEREKIRKLIDSIPDGSYIWAIIGGEPTKVLIVRHGDTMLTCRLDGQIIDVDFDQIILETK